MIVTLMFVFFGVLLVMLWSAIRLSSMVEAKDEDSLHNIGIYSPKLNPSVTYQILKKYGFKYLNHCWYYTKYISHDDTITFNVKVDLHTKGIFMNITDELTYEDFPYKERLSAVDSGEHPVPDEMRYMLSCMVEELDNMQHAGIIVGYHRGDCI